MVTMKQELKQALFRRQKQCIINNSHKQAAVLLPIYHKNGKYYILFTKRTERVMTHKGQISFPGGTLEQGDTTLLDTALRECDEEIGLTPDKVEILGELDDITTETTGYIISPFIGLIPYPYQFKVNGEEIEEIIEVPISALLDRTCLHSENMVREGKIVNLYFYNYQGRVIWGATARILRQFLDIFVQAI